MTHVLVSKNRTDNNTRNIPLVRQRRRRPLFSPKRAPPDNNTGSSRGGGTGSCRCCPSRPCRRPVATVTSIRRAFVRVCIFLVYVLFDGFYYSYDDCYQNPLSAVAGVVVGMHPKVTTFGGTSSWIFGRRFLGGVGVHCFRLQSFASTITAVGHRRRHHQQQEASFRIIQADLIRRHSSSSSISFTNIKTISSTTSSTTTISPQKMVASSSTDVSEGVFATESSLSSETAAAVNGASPTKSQQIPTNEAASYSTSQHIPYFKNNISPKARIVSVHDVDWDCLDACGERLREGGLVAFPTETVYGLGCSALNERAIHKVFEAKERPLTDPLIVHVLHHDDAFQLWHASEASFEGQILSTLCRTFWPGPLTLVAKAKRKGSVACDDGHDVNAEAVVPDCIMAGTGYVACRSPSHGTARALIEAARVPLAAPSANKFGHVSPTTYQHVYDDLHNEDVWILRDDGGGISDSAKNNRSAINVRVHQRRARDDDTKLCCNVGVESTVAKLEVLTRDGSPGGVEARLIVLRQGAVSEQALRECLQNDEGIAKALSDGKAGQHQLTVTRLNRATSDHVANVAPGQTIRHYSPHIPSYMVSERCYASATAAAVDSDSTSVAAAAVKLQDAVIVDFGQQLLRWGKGGVVRDESVKVLAYRDLSPSGNATEAAKVIFDTLRWAESVPGAKRILFPSAVRQNDIDTNNQKTCDEENDGLLLAIQDRLTRAASGVVIDKLEDS